MVLPRRVPRRLELQRELGRDDYQPVFLGDRATDEFPAVGRGNQWRNTLVVQGAHGILSVAGPLMVDSTTDGAVSVGATGDLVATGYYTAGTGIATCAPMGMAMCPPLWAPLPPRATRSGRWRPVSPDRGSCNVAGSVDTCTPGTYAMDPHPGGGPVTTVVFQPGIYVFNNGLTLNGPISVQGSSVLFYISGGKANLTPKSWSITPPSSGTYNGILLFQSRTNTMNTVVLGGNASTTSMSGLIYVPTAPVQFMSNIMGMTTNTLTVGSLWAQTVTVQDNTSVVVG